MFLEDFFWHFTQCPNLFGTGFVNVRKGNESKQLDKLIKWKKSRKGEMGEGEEPNKAPVDYNKCDKRTKAEH